jgi:hypothetical protein
MLKSDVIRYGPSSGQLLGFRVSLKILCTLSALCLALGAGCADWKLLAQGAFWGGLAWLNRLALRPDGIYLELSPDGFTERQVLFTLARRWNELECFGTEKVDGETLVVFRDTGSSKRSLLARTKWSRNGWNGRLMGHYGISDEELADLLEVWRQRQRLKPAATPELVDDLL